MKYLLLCPLVLLSSSLAACGSDTGDTTGNQNPGRADGGSQPTVDLYTLDIVNSTSHDVYEVYVSLSDDESWGPELLGNDVLEPDDTLIIAGLECGEYDFKIVDLDGVECVADDPEYVCEDDALFYIDSDTFSNCFPE